MTRRPRLLPLTPEDLRRRVAEYCSRYGVEPQTSGLPPFPAGERETLQHREWLRLYKASRRFERDARSGPADAE